MEVNVGHAGNKQKVFANVIRIVIRIIYVSLDSYTRNQRSDILKERLPEESKINRMQSFINRRI